MALSLAPLHSLSAEACQNLQLIASDMDGTLSQGGKFQSTLFTALEQLQAAGLPVLIVTGRSAGWVQSIAQYLPVCGAIAENGGLFFRPPHYELELLVEIGTIAEHRAHLAQTFAKLQDPFPQLQESTDNRFRVTDWTFDVAGLGQDDLRSLQVLCQADGWDFTYSTVQCHIRPQGQDKSVGIQRLVTQMFPERVATPEQILTVGDSPNDASLFNPKDFPQSVGVANVRHYTDQLPHSPRYITQTEEGAGFCELVDHVLTARASAGMEPGGVRQ